MQIASLWRHSICGLSGCGDFLVISSPTARFLGSVCDMEFAFWFSLQHSSESLPSSRRLQRNAVLNVRRCSCKVLFCPTWNEREFTAHISVKTLQDKISIESLKWKANYFTRMDGQTGRRTHNRDEINNSRFHNCFTNAHTWYKLAAESYI
jgi:hypothetical protein